jgi:ABC-type branched-subunit amino acid transport system substrate-binding protein
MRRAALAAAALVASCTPADYAAPPTPGPTEASSASPSPPSVAVPVVAADGEPSVDGMLLAVEETGIGLEVRDPRGDPAAALRDAVSSRPPAVLVAGLAGAVAAARPEIETAGVPVILVGGDLYSERRLFRYAFQVSAPLRWQARVLAHYLVTDRRHQSIALVGEVDVAAAALTEEGVSPTEDVQSADAVLALAGAPGGLAGPQLAVSAGALGSPAPLPPGTVACGPYTWAGWAEPIPRVARFRGRFAERFGREPGLREQEGYEAVRALEDALAATGGRGGDALIRALERFREETYSSTPIRLGPDDHVLAEESHLGLFAVAAPDGRAPGEDLEPVPWRPVMRTFTTNGKRVNLAERDVRVFFPRWRPMRPRPNYWRSEYGIVTRPDEDPLN